MSSVEKLFSLPELGAMLAKVDRTVISLLARRMALSLQVFAIKKASTEKVNEENPDKNQIIEIIRADKEIERVALAEEWAKKFGLNPLFARAMMYAIINESCKVQLEEMQTGKTDIRSIDHATSSGWYEALKSNLLKLTKIVAADYDKIYLEEAPFSIASTRQFEYWVIKEVILEKLSSKSLALDLGCATGLTSLELTNFFDQVKGFDISPDMITVAENKKTGLGIENVSFTVADIETGLPISDGVVSLVVLTQGVASDIRNIKLVMKEIERVLRPGGRVFLSFYNKDALLYQFSFIPWPVSLLAEINFKAQCLEVNLSGLDPFFIYARGYNTNEIAELFSGRLMLEDIFTYPTVSSILPEHLLDNEAVCKGIKEIDKSLAASTYGSYIMVVGVKR